MNYEVLISDYETKAYVNRANAISVEIESYLGFKTGDVMEFGCKTGLIAFNLKNKVNELFLVDNSEEMIQAVNHKLKNRQTNITVHSDSILDSNFKKEFDVIYISLTLHHIKNVQEFINKLAGFLKKNGKLIIVDFLPDNGILHNNQDNFEGHHGFKVEEISQILETAGLVEVMGRKFYSSYQRFNGSSHPYSLFSCVGQKQ